MTTKTISGKELLYTVCDCDWF